MDKSVKAANVAEKHLHKVKAALAASRRFSREYDMAFWALMAAEQNYRAALRAETVPRVACACCERKFKPDEPMVWQWQLQPYGYQSVQLCLRCHQSKHPDQLADLDQQPCETCARPMYLDGYHSFHRRRPLTCSYQCSYRRKLKHQSERKRVEHEPITCAVCGEMFTPTRSDAKTCSGKCRQKLYREARARRGAAPTQAAMARMGAAVVTAGAKKGAVL
jgi:predicted nucleic acid-binding Zn ribbon protein